MVVITTLDGADTVVHLECELEDQQVGGDYRIALGRVQHLTVHRAEGAPLLFCHHCYGQFRKAESP